VFILCFCSISPATGEHLDKWSGVVPVPRLTLRTGGTPPSTKLNHNLHFLEYMERMK
jgi:hypothetical protein